MLTTVNLFYTSDKKKVFDPQQGSGAQRYGLQAQSFRRLDSLSSIWGLASYEQGRVNSVRWNETSDLQWVYPYVLGDSVGGNQRQEYYHFKGGYNRSVGKYTLGISGDYLAASTYRAVDPRTDNTSSDLTIGVGVSRPIAQYRLALNYAYRYYTQHNTVKIASPISSPAFYHLIGMGVDQKLFWGKNTDSYYLGNAHTIGLALQPLADVGFYFSTQYKTAYIDKSITNLRSLVVAHARTKEGEVTVAYYAKQGRGRWLPTLQGYYKERNGTSYIFEQVSSTNYNKLGELNDFTHQQYAVQASVQVQYPLTATIDWKIAPQLVLNHEKTAYVPQQRSMEWNNLSYGATFGLIKQKRKHTAWDIQGDIYKRHAMDRNIAVTTKLSSPALAQLVTDQYVYNTKGYMRYGIQGNYYFPLQATLLAKVGIEANMQQYGKGLTNQLVAVRIGLLL